MQELYEIRNSKVVNGITDYFIKRLRSGMLTCSVGSNIIGEIYRDGSFKDTSIGGLIKQIILKHTHLFTDSNDISGITLYGPDYGGWRDPYIGFVPKGEPHNDVRQMSSGDKHYSELIDAIDNNRDLMENMPRMISIQYDRRNDNTSLALTLMLQEFANYDILYRLLKDHNIDVDRPDKKDLFFINILPESEKDKAIEIFFSKK